MLRLTKKEGLKQCLPADVIIGAFRDSVKNVLGSPNLLEALTSVCFSLKSANMIPELNFETR